VAAPHAVGDHACPRTEDQDARVEAKATTPRSHAEPTAGT
jgi:hypothetical protein